jgi:uncharacterized protein
MKKIFFLSFYLISQLVLAQREIPPLWGHHVHDDAHILSGPAIDELEMILTRHEDSTSNQIAIYIISSLEGEPIEQLSLRVAHDEWKLGQAKNDNGVLLLIAVDDRQMRIEVGQGLEGVLTDARCSQIIRNEIAPRFRGEHYDEGVIFAVNAIGASIIGEYTADAPGSPGEASGGELVFYGIFVFGILGIFTIVGLFTPGCGGWFLYAFLIPFYATFPMFILGSNAGIGLLGLYAVGMPIAKWLIGRSVFGQRIAARMSKRTGGRSGGWSSGSGWSSGGWGSSSGGGFSGGGGSFGGGGSSGSW